MDRKTHLLCEAVQEVTLYAWPIVWADNKYDQDSRDVLETLRGWAETFEDWWTFQTQDYMDAHDWLEEIWAYTNIQCRKYLWGLGVDCGLEGRVANVQDFTARAIDAGIFSDMCSAPINMSRTKCFDTIRQWADEFWGEYVVGVGNVKCVTFTTLVSDFLANKFADLKMKSGTNIA